ALGAGDEDARLALEPPDQLVLRPRRVGVVGLDLELGPQAVGDLGKDPAADEDGWLRGHALRGRWSGRPIVPLPPAVPREVDRGELDRDGLLDVAAIA